MKLNYEVEWELDDEVIDNIVDEVEEKVNQYPDCNVDDWISEITGYNLRDTNFDECDHFNMNIYLDKVIQEVKKRYLDRKNNNMPISAVPLEGKHSGYIQRIDNLGRIYIPTEFIDSLDLKQGDPFEIFFDTDHNIILKKYHK